jgi:hypothetical protein
MSWAALLLRVLDVDALSCPGCGTAMVVLAFLTDPAVVRRILDHLDLPSAAPKIARARGYEDDGWLPLDRAGYVQELCPESPLAWLWKLGDGAHATTPFASHAWADDGTYVVTACARDPQNAEGYDEAQVVIANASPVADAGPDRAASQGEVVVFSGSFSDPGGLDTHTGSLTPVHAFTSAGAHTVRLQVEDNGLYAVTMRALDPLGGSASDTAWVSVSNQPPAAEAGPALTGLEGAQLPFAGVASDLGPTDTLSYAWSFGDGGLAATREATHAYRDQGNYADAGVNTPLRSRRATTTAPRPRTSPGSP